MAVAKRITPMIISIKPYSLSFFVFSNRDLNILFVGCVKNVINNPSTINNIDIIISIIALINTKIEAIL